MQGVVFICEPSFKNNNQKPYFTREVIKEMQNIFPKSIKINEKYAIFNASSSVQQAWVENLLCAEVLSWALGSEMLEDRV